MQKDIVPGAHTCLIRVSDCQAVSTSQAAGVAILAHLSCHHVPAIMHGMHSRLPSGECPLLPDGSSMAVDTPLTKVDVNAGDRQRVGGVGIGCNDGDIVLVKADRIE